MYFFFLRFVAVIEDGQRANACVSRETHRKAVRPSHAFGYEHGAFEVESQAFQFFRDRAPEKSELADLLQKLGGEPFFQGLDAFEVGDDALGHKVEASLEHHAVLFRPFFWRENVVGTHVSNQKFTACDCLLWGGVSSCHVQVD